MKKNIFALILGFGWILLALFLVSGYLVNTLSNNQETSFFSPIPWESHLQLFNGAIQCSLTDGDLLERKKQLKSKIFANNNAAHFSNLTFQYSPSKKALPSKFQDQKKQSNF